MAEPDSASLAGALDRVLDKGVVVDVQARISLVGIDVMSVEGQVVAASLDTYYENREEIAAVERAGPGSADGTEEIVGDVVDTATDAVASATDAVESTTGELAGGESDGGGQSGGGSGADAGPGTDAGDGDGDDGDDADESAAGDDDAETDESNDVPEGKVRCRECGDLYEAITPSHLATHDTTVAAYREEYGEDVPMNFGGV